MLVFFRFLFHFWEELSSLDNSEKIEDFVRQFKELSIFTIYIICSVIIQEYYIRHLDENRISSEEERERLMLCLEAAIQRRNTDVRVSCKSI